MEFCNLLEMEEQQQNQMTPAEFIMKPSGEVQVKGSPDLVHQAIVSYDYHKDQERRLLAQTKEKTNTTDLISICFVGSTFLIALYCLFLTMTRGEQNNGKYPGGNCTSQIQQANRYR